MHRNNKGIAISTEQINIVVLTQDSLIIGREMGKA